MQSLCVYCGSQNGTDSDHMRAAERLGMAMAANGIRLVYGGGANGMMGTVARAVLAGGGEVTGIIPDFLIRKESAQGWLTQLTDHVVTEDMHARKHAMFDQADGFVALPGGIGTLEELVEIMTWGQLGRHRKPIVIANIGGFWDPLLSLLDHMREQGFIHTQRLVQPIVESDPDRIVPRLMDAQSNGGEASIIEKL